MACPGSVQAEAGLPDTPSKYAQEGTDAHAVAAAALAPLPAGAPPPAFDADDLAYIDQYVEYVRNLPGHKMIETRVDIGAALGIPDQFGTADAIAIDLESRTLRVVDLKFGRGIRVEAGNNPQLALYAAGALALVETFIDDGAITTITAEIVQPRLDHLSIAEYSYEALAKYVSEIRAAALRTQEPDAPRNPGDHCRFCKAAATCPALRQEVDSIVFDPIMPDAVNPPPTDAAALARAKSEIPMIEAYIAAIEQSVFQRLEVGEDVPGWKLVLGRRGPRKWADPENAERVLLTLHGQDGIYELASPTQIAKRVDAIAYNAVESYITQSEGKPSVVPSGDKREAIKPKELFE